MARSRREARDAYIYEEEQEKQREARKQELDRRNEYEDDDDFEKDDDEEEEDKRVSDEVKELKIKLDTKNRQDSKRSHFIDDDAKATTPIEKQYALVIILNYRILKIK